MGLLPNNSTVVPTGTELLRPVGDGSYSALDADGGLLPGLRWRHRAARGNGYSIVETADGLTAWAVDERGLMYYRVQ